MSPSLNSLVDDILAFRGKALSPADLGGILERNATTIQQACKTGQIEAQSTCARGHGQVRRWIIPKASALRYLWLNTSGDKALLRAALAEKAPALLRTLESGGSEERRVKGEEAEPSTRSRPERAANILSFNAEHDLFPELAPAVKPEAA